MPAGRPAKYESAQDMQVAIDKYFDKTEKMTICGLALSLGFNSRQSLLNYEGYSEEFMDTIKAAKSRIEQYYEEHLTQPGAAGSIFALKNFHWKDKQTQEHVIDKDTATLLGLIDGNSKGQLPNRQEAEDAG